MASSIKPYPITHCVRAVKETDLEEFFKLVEMGDWFLTMQKLNITFHEELVDYYVLEDIKSKQVLGAMNVTPTRPNEAIVGNVIIRPDLRSQGLGSYFLTEIFKLYPSTILCWFSEADSFYERLGAKASGESGMYYEVDINRGAIDTYCEHNDPVDVVTIPFTMEKFEDLHKYDIEARGYDNRPYLSVVTRTSDHTILAVTKDDQQRIVGYGSSWEDKSALRFNGLYADDDKIAALLLRKSLNKYSKNLDIVKYFTMNNSFILQFGELKVTGPHNRFTYGGSPVVIPKKKLYCLTEADMSY